VLRDATWQDYSRLLRVFAERPKVRLTYDRGVLEILMPGREHEVGSDLLACFVVVLTEELRQPRASGGSVTLRRRRKLRGLEPDKCWWLANEPAVRGKAALDLRIDPPPDLAIEVDVTHSSLDRMSIYAKLRVPEIWRLDGSVLTFHILGSDGRYAPAMRSLSFPMISPADLMQFLAQAPTLDETNLVLQFRTWFRQHLAASPSP
jgi:Uma2 family endonuclease